MTDYEKLLAEIGKLKDRNRRVELDKEWEMSLFRKVLIAFFTYFVVVLFFYFMHLEKPFINSLVPTLGFLLSTLSMSFFKNLWMKNKYRK